MLYSYKEDQMRLFEPLVVTFLAFSPMVALAHGPENGGQQQKIGSYEAELVVKGSEMALYLVDGNEKKADATGFTANAVVLTKDGQKTVVLAPAGGNKLTGKGDLVVENKFRATITLLRGNTEVGKGRYNLDVK